MINEKISTRYESPELEIIAFDSCDIITTSGYGVNGTVPDVNEDTDWFNN